MAVHAADSARQVADSVTAVADSLRRVNDQVARREQAARDSIHALLEQADLQIDAASLEHASWSAALDTTLASLREQVRPGLRGLVDAAIRQKEGADTNAGRLLAALAAKARLLAMDTASLASELGATRAELIVRRSEAEHLRAALSSSQAALAAMADARDRWRRLAAPPFWQAFIGRDVLAGLVTVAGGVAAFRVDAKVGAGYVGAKALEAALAAARR